MYKNPARPQLNLAGGVGPRVGPGRDYVPDRGGASPEEEQGIARVERIGGDDFVLVVPAAVRLLALEEDARALAEPPVAAHLFEQAQRADPLDAVEVVEMAGFPLPGILVDRPLGREPGESIIDALVELFAALLPQGFAEDGLCDGQGAHSRAGHLAANPLPRPPADPSALC